MSPTSSVLTWCLHDSPPSSQRGHRSALSFDRSHAALARAMLPARAPIHQHRVAVVDQLGPAIDLRGPTDAQPRRHTEAEQQSRHRPLRAAHLGVAEGGAHEVGPLDRHLGAGVCLDQRARRRQPDVLEPGLLHVNLRVRRSASPAKSATGKSTSTSKVSSAKQAQSKASAACMRVRLHSGCARRALRGPRRPWRSSPWCRGSRVRSRTPPEWPRAARRPAQRNTARPVGQTAENGPE